MICTRRTTIVLHADLANLTPDGLQRLTIDELGALVERIELETQTLNRMRRFVGRALVDRMNGVTQEPNELLARRARRSRRARV